MPDWNYRYYDGFTWNYRYVDYAPPKKDKPKFEVGDIVKITNVEDFREEVKWVLNKRAVVTRVCLSYVTLTYPAHIIDKYGSEEDKNRKLNCNYEIVERNFYRIEKIN